MPEKPFRLETYLKLCRQRLDEAQREHAQAQMRLTELESQSAALTQQLDVEIDQLDAYMRHSICAGALEETTQYLNRLKRDRDQLQAEISAARADLEQRKARLLDAHIEVKKYEKLKERATAS